MELLKHRAKRQSMKKCFPFFFHPVVQEIFGVE